MRKQDRVQQEQNRSEQQQGPKPQGQSREEHVKGSGSANQPMRPPRESGKLPLPD